MFLFWKHALFFVINTTLALVSKTKNTRIVKIKMTEGITIPFCHFFSLVLDTISTTARSLVAFD